MPARLPRPPTPEPPASVAPQLTRTLLQVCDALIPLSFGSFFGNLPWCGFIYIVFINGRYACSLKPVDPGLDHKEPKKKLEKEVKNGQNTFLRVFGFFISKFLAGSNPADLGVFGLFSG